MLSAKHFCVYDVEATKNKINFKPMFSDKSLSFIRKNTASLYVTLSVALLCPQVLHGADENSYAQEIQQDVAENKVYLLENIRQKVTIPSEKTVMEALFCEDGPQAIMLFQKQLREYPDPALDKLSTSRITAYNLALDRTSSTQKVSIPAPSIKPKPEIVKADTTQTSSKKQVNTLRPSIQLQPSVVREDSSTHSSKPQSNPLLPAVLKVDTTTHSLKPRTKPALSSSETSKEEKTVAGTTTFILQFGSFESYQNAESLAKKLSQNVSVEIIRKGQMYKVLLKTHYPSKEEAGTAAKKLPVKAIVVPSI